MLRSAIVSAASAALLALAGCGGGGTTTVTDGSPPRVSSAATTSATATTTATQAAPVHLDSFRSPSGNIGCMLIGGVARCDIQRRDWRPPARPKDCPQIVDYGQGLEIGSSGAARFVCAGDTARDPAAPALAYGRTSEAGGFSCESATTGVTCRRSDGHGFFLSIQSYRIF
ncbi:MAG TPA: DUF6636 domain-containing protein [Solirubrobacteraceae bacterium]|nr:DUF6636 domain-containing protein [Solirubrobacteraceae bacterium]